VGDFCYAIKLTIPLFLLLYYNKDVNNILLLKEVQNEEKY